MRVNISTSVCVCVCVLAHRHCHTSDIPLVELNHFTWCLFLSVFSKFTNVIFFPLTLHLYTTSTPAPLACQFDCLILLRRRRLHFFKAKPANRRRSCSSTSSSFSSATSSTSWWSSFTTREQIKRKFSER